MRKPSRSLVTLLHLGWSASRRAQVRAFERASREPERFQAAWLRTFLEQNRDTAYGRATRYATLDSPDAYRRRVPVVGWEELKPWVERIENGERLIELDVWLGKQDADKVSTGSAIVMLHAQGDAS